ncbi:hypothetical protein EG68_02429 [Paragonimus skrjabini miyazakii]|uniref:Uncharacterized protein n=1 Tax=Paragonimus skrjabini miyazakii TaxID=59628 RepID=A0A8S9Z328_9TREM|nr:hypothetical protein EG68_02429 [Paragonimus skrjabini miyazakii]
MQHNQVCSSSKHGTTSMEDNELHICSSVPSRTWKESEICEYLEEIHLRKIWTSAGFKPATETTYPNAASALPAELRSHTGSSEILHLNLVTRPINCVLWNPPNDPASV